MHWIVTFTAAFKSVGSAFPSIGRKCVKFSIIYISCSQGRTKPPKNSLTFQQGFRKFQMVQTAFISLVVCSTSPTPTPCHHLLMQVSVLIHYLQLLYLSTRQFFFAFIVRYKWRANGIWLRKFSLPNSRIPRQLPEIPVKKVFRDVPRFSRKWEHWLSVAKYTFASDDVKIHRHFVLTDRMSSHSSLIRWSLWLCLVVEPTAAAPDAELDSGATGTDQTPVWDTSRQQETAVHWQCTPYGVDSCTQNLCLYSF